MSSTSNPRPVRRASRSPEVLRLPPGQLRARVLGHLRRYPGLDFGPTDLARAIGRPGSRGAVINACRRLTEQGLADRVQDRPQRYRATTPPTQNPTIAVGSRGS